MTKLPPVITVDGPSGSGKSAVCKILSHYLKWCNLESGLMYRILACLFLKKNVPIVKKYLISIFYDLDLYFFYKNGMIYNIIEKEFSHQYIMSQKVTDISSQLAALPYVRNHLLLKQRLFRQNPGLVANGRDMGTVVFPDAIIKFFLEATLQERTYRRMLHLQQKGLYVNYTDLMEQIQKRDDRDINRVYSPLQPAKDAIILDSSNITLQQVVNIAISYIENHHYFKINPVYN